MARSREETKKEHDRLAAMLDEVSRELKARFPEVQSVEVGLKSVDGKLKKELAFVIYVTEKKSPGELKPEEMIPREIRGTPTDIEQFLIDSPYQDTDDYRPLWGGVQITADGVGGDGTLGCFATLTGQSEIQILTNHHVIIGANGAVGNKVGQASLTCASCCCACGDVAKVSAGQVGVPAPRVGTPNLVDAALAKLYGQDSPGDKHFHYTNKIINIGPVFGSDAPMVDDIVRKRGRTTRYTEGTIRSITASPTVNYGTTANPILIPYTNQVRITPNPGFARFSAPGDSGSAILNNRNQVVALLFAGNAATTSANSITDVINRLGIAILSSGTPGAIPISGVDVAEYQPVRHETLMMHLSRKLGQNQSGRELLHVIRENHREVLDLVNEHREVKVAWQRFQGPAFVGHLVKNAREKSHPIPRQINGYSFHNLLIKMSDVLETSGSVKLAAAVDKYAITAFQFADDYKGIESLDPLLEKYNLCPKCGSVAKNTPYA